MHFGIHLQTKNKLAFLRAYFLGGGEGNRTPVRKSILTVFYECIRLFAFPSYAENRRSS